MENRQRLFVLGEEETQQRDGDGDGDDFLRRDGQPEKSQIGAGSGNEPLQLKISTQGKGQIRPAVGDEPGDAQTEQQPWIQEELERFF